MYKEKFEQLTPYGEAFVEKFFSYASWSTEIAEKVCTLLDFCDAYVFEDELTAYMQEHPKATIDEMGEYFCDTAPTGLPTRPGL